jgi:serine/threonine protein kinase
VGISLFELIAGCTPFEEEYHSDTINNITSMEVSFDSKHFSRFSSLVKDLILRLLKKDPAERLTCE